MIRNRVNRTYRTQRVWDQISPSDLLRLFVDERRSAEEIAPLFGVGPTLIRRILRRMGVNTNPTRTRPLEQSYAVDVETGCWLWTAQLDRKGYPVAWNPDDATNRRAHRLLYERTCGPIPDGMQLDHLCRVRRCVNPVHMQPVTNAENQQRGAKAKVTADQVREMRRLYTEGLLTQDALAVNYGIHVETVRGILKRKSWANV